MRVVVTITEEYYDGAVQQYRVETVWDDITVLSEDDRKTRFALLGIKYRRVALEFLESPVL